MPLNEIDPTPLILARLDGIDRKLEDMVPRKEHEAHNLPARMTGMETRVADLTASLIKATADLRELIITTVNAAVKESLQRELASQSEDQSEQSEHFRWLSAQGLAILLPLLFFGLNVVFTILFYMLTHK